MAVHPGRASGTEPQRGAAGLAAHVRVEPLRAPLARASDRAAADLRPGDRVPDRRRASCRVRAGSRRPGSLGGYVFWTLTEYWLHRLVFHFEPEQRDRRPAALDHPRRPSRPPERSAAAGHASRRSACRCRRCSCSASTPSSAARASCRSRRGFLGGYLFYDMLHYHVHHHTPTTALGKQLRELHMRHHFQNHERGYGVSAPFWDYVFGTPLKSAPLVPPAEGRGALRSAGSRWRCPSGGSPTRRSPPSSGSTPTGSSSGPAPHERPWAIDGERLSDFAAQAAASALERAGVPAERGRPRAGRHLDR